MVADQLPFMSNWISGPFFFHRQAKLRVTKYFTYYSVIFMYDASRDASKSAVLILRKTITSRKDQ